MNNLKNRILGSMAGGAAGDALGYEVEFLKYNQIVENFGQHGIRRFALHNGVAHISDDTQMSLFTANALINYEAHTRIAGAEMRLEEYICNAYLEWLVTQSPNGFVTEPHSCWISEIPELNDDRAPGLTCISALESIAQGRRVVNDSKGCGGVMRIAPIGLYAATGAISHEDAVRLGFEAANMTHKHPLGALPAALLVHLVANLAVAENPTAEDFKHFIKTGIALLRKLYPAFEKDIETLDKIIAKAVNLTRNTIADTEAVTALGEGWVAEETLAIAVYCALKYWNDFEHAVIASVNHSGDSDSTGAVTGNIVGAAVGYDAIPNGFKDNLEIRNIIEEIAVDLFEVPSLAHYSELESGVRTRWKKKYCR